MACNAAGLSSTNAARVRCSSPARDRMAISRDTVSRRAPIRAASSSCVGGGLTAWVPSARGRPRRSSSAASRSRDGRAVCSSDRRFCSRMRDVNRRSRRRPTLRDANTRSRKAAAGTTQRRVRTNASTRAERWASSMADISPTRWPAMKSPRIWVRSPSAVRTRTRTLPCTIKYTSVVVSSKSTIICPGPASIHRACAASRASASAGAPARNCNWARARAGPVGHDIITILYANAGEESRILIKYVK